MVEEELQALDRRRRDEEEVKRGATSGDNAQEDASKDELNVLLRQRIQEVQRAETTRSLAELMHLEVVHEFQRLEVPLVPPLAGEHHVSFGPVDLKGLASMCTGLNPNEALELLKEHVLNTIKEWDHLVRDYPLQLALFQVGQAYSMSALFGYSLRQVDARYRLEEALAGGGRARAEEEAPRDAITDLLSQLTNGGAPKSMKEYVSSFGPQDHQHMLKMLSLEAEAVLDRQVSRLFGDLPGLTDELLQALGPAASPLATRQEQIAQLRRALVDGEVQSVTLTVGDLRRLALEGAAFGFLLGDAEARAASVLDLSPGASNYPLLTFSTGGQEEDPEVTWSQGFRILGT
jgi:hypothetical protein